MARIKSLSSSLIRLDQRSAPPPPKVAEPFYSSAEWRELVAELIRERGARCEICGRPGRVVGEHVKELRDGGAPLDRRNVKLSCWPCHTIKTNVERAKRIAAPLPSKG